MPDNRDPKKNGKAIPRTASADRPRASSGERPRTASAERPKPGDHSLKSAGEKSKRRPKDPGNMVPVRSTGKSQDKTLGKAAARTNPPHKARPNQEPSRRRPGNERQQIQETSSRTNMDEDTDLRTSAPISRIDHLRNVNRKRTLYRAFFLWLVVLLFMVVAAAAILYVTDYVAPKPHYAFISTGTIEHTIGTSALIIRDEKIFTTSTEGSLVTMALEGSRVSKDQLVAMVIPEGTESTTESLNHIQMQIAERQRMLLDSGKGSAAQTYFDEADNNMAPIINMMRHDSISGNMSNLVSYSSSIQVLMDKRDFLIQSVDFSDEELNTLHSQKDALEKSLSANADDFRAEIPGIVSFKLDGFEGQLSSSSVATISPEELDQYLASSSGSMMSKITVQENSSVFRICQNAEQYFVAVVEGFSITDFPLDSTVNIRVTTEGIVISDCKIIRSIQSTGGVFIVLQTTSSVERLLDRRTIEIELIRKSTSGLRVPVSSLIDADYTTGYAQMMYNASGYARLVTVKVNDHDREYAIIEPAEGFDYPNDSTIIITNPETISEGEKVEQ